MDASDLDLATCEYDVRRKQAAEQRHARLIGAHIQEEKRLDALARTLRIEEEDVERLEGMSLAAFITTLRGIRDERLKAEREEYVAAKLRYDESAAALESLLKQITEVGAEVREMTGAEARYEAALAARERQVLASSPVIREQVAAVAQEMGRERARVRELEESLTAADAAARALGAVRKELGNAANWGTWDTWGGGGLISTAMKHSYIDRAREAAARARQALQRLNIELADVGIDGEGLEVQLGEFHTLADYLLDGFWTDMSVQCRIEDASHRVVHAARQVAALGTRLRAEAVRAARRIGELEGERRALLRAEPAEVDGDLSAGTRVTPDSRD